MGLFAVLVIGAYLVGSIPFGLLVTKLIGGVDIRLVGSGNIGATNVLRAVGKGPAVLTLVLDFLKGFLPVFLMQRLGGSEIWIAGAGLAAFLGHLYPIFLGLKGGKGVATALGVLLGIMPLVALLGVGIWLATALIWRYSSLAALTAALVIPFLAWALYGMIPYLLFAGVLSILVIYRHHENIKRLLAGTESRIGQKLRADG